jgi:periplasmic divalent cation tolerance protein
MKSGKKFALVLVTAPDVRTARRLATVALSARLVACVNLVPKIESHYWWQGKLESGSEVLLVMKTLAKRLSALEKLVLSQHPYDTPEFVILEFQGGSGRYLDWITQSVHPRGGRTRGSRRDRQRS